MKFKTLVGICLLSLVAVPGAFAQNEYYLSQVANGGGYRTTFVLFNNTDTDTTAFLELTGDTGGPLSVTITGLGTDSEFNISLSAGATRILQTDGAGSVVVGAATVTAPVKIGVSAIFSIYDANGNYLTEAGVGSSEPLTEFILPVDTTGLFNTGLALFNPSSGNAAITMTLRGTNGQTSGQPATIPLNQNNHLARFVAGVNQFFPSLGSFQGTLRVQSSVPIAALVLRQNQTPLSFTSLPVVPASAAKLNQNLAQVANGSYGGGSFKTSFLFFNISSGTANVALSLTKDTGSAFPVNIPGYGTNSTFNIPLAAGASVFLQTDGTGSLTAGAATITSNVPIGACAIFSVYNAQGAFQTEAGVGDSPVLTTLTLPVDVSGSFNTGVAFFNPGAAQITLTLKLLDGNGAISGSTDPIPLPAKNQTAKFVTDIFPGTSNFRGSLAITSTAGVAAVTLRQNDPPLSYTTLPVASGTASGKTPAAILLSKTQTGISATGNIAVNETLPPGFKLTGRISGPGQAYEVIAQGAGASNIFVGEVNSQTGQYLIVLGSGTYTLKVCFRPNGVPSGASVTVTHSDPAPVQVSGDTTRDIALPAVNLFSISGTVAGLSNIPSSTGASVVFTSNDHTIQGDFTLGTTGAYQGTLPNGGYKASVTVPSISFSMFQSESLDLYNLGTASVSGGPITANYSVPATARISGTISGGGVSTLTPGISVSAWDTSAPLITEITCAYPPADSSASADMFTNQYQMILASGRTYQMEVMVPLLQGTNMLGVLLFPVAASTVNLTGDTTYNFNLPGLPGEVTVSGRVTDSGGRGVADVAVSAFSQSLTGAANISFAAGVSTDANGNYSIKVLSGTAYQILFYPPIPTP